MEKVISLEIEKEGTLWLLLGALLFLLDIIVVGINRWEFPYGLVYAIGAIGVGIVMNSDRPSLLGAACAAINGALATWIQIELTYYTVAQTYAVISVFLLLFVILCELEYLAIGGKTKSAKYIVMVALLAWFLFPATYFLQRIRLGMPLPAATILYHGGIMALAFVDFLAMLGVTSFRETKTLRWVLAFITIIGAILLTVVLGWGLQLIH